MLYMTYFKELFYLFYLCIHFCKLIEFNKERGSLAQSNIAI